MSDLTKTQIKKLGKAIRREQQQDIQISKNLLIELQKYRTSFKRDISEVFNILSDASKRIRKDRVVTFRIKRIESILSKLQRQPTMQLDTMGDIAGCRCIVPTDASVIKIIEVLEKKFVVRRRKDYLTLPKEDGYKAFHLYVESPIDSNKHIEIQIRSRESHNWATLVEIIDVLYNKKIKEGEQHPELREFLMLMSKKANLEYHEKDRIIDIEAKHNIYIKLSELFSKNYMIIRNAWLDLESKGDNTYFVIEVNQHKRPTINSYKHYDEAESIYFLLFSKNKDSNVVLTHLDSVDFGKLCIAYSNYILIKHSFLNDWQRIMLDQIETDYSHKNRKKANIVVESFKATLKKERSLLNKEMLAIKDVLENRNEEHFLSNDTKVDEWIEELQERVDEGRHLSKELDALLQKNGRSPISQFFMSTST